MRLSRRGLTAVSLGLRQLASFRANDTMRPIPAEDDKTWMPGTRPGMTARTVVTFQLTSVPKLVTFPTNQESRPIEGTSTGGSRIGGAGAVPAGGLATRSRAVRVSTPPALRPAREVPRLSAVGGAGNARVSRSREARPGLSRG